LYQTGDTQGWVSGSKWLKDCIFLVSSEACQRISYWPIWNNSLALMFSWFTGNQVKLWYYLNMLCFVVYLLVIVYSVQQLSFKWRFLIVYAIIFSPLLFYVHSTFTEIQQGLFLTLALFSFIKRRMLTSSILIAFSIITKETFILLWIIILIFLIIKDTMNNIDLVHMRISIHGFSSKFMYLFKMLVKNTLQISLFKNRILQLIVGILLGSLMNLTFNYLRYHQVKNTAYYSSNISFSMDLYYTVLNFIWSLISPNGGIVFAYGFFLTIILLYSNSHQKIQLSALLNLKNLAKEYTTKTVSTNAESSLVEVHTLIIIVLLCGLLTTSLWWAAFGWDTWGHRLMIPYIMPVHMLITISTQNHSDYSRTLMNTRKLKYVNINHKSMNLFHTSINTLKIISILILVMCGLIYNLVTIQAVYRKDRDVVRESLFSQPWCREMVSDDRGIRPYYWRCVLERFQYIPILHHPPRIQGHEGKILISIAFISLFINLPFTRLWIYGNRLIEHQPKKDRG